MTLLQPHDPTAPWRSYRILRGEQGVFHYEPYKSTLLPLWRFKTPSIARESSTALWNRYQEYEERRDFVGMDMCRKFLQMGVTRCKRYANWRGGRKYEYECDDDGGRGKVRGKVREKGEGRKEKEEAGRMFREVWERVKGREAYQSAKGEFLARQRRWDRDEVKRREGKRKGDGVDGEEGGDDGSEDGDGVEGGRGQEEGKCESMRWTKRRAVEPEGGEDSNGVLRDESKDGDDGENGGDQEEGKRRSKRRKKR